MTKRLIVTMIGVVALGCPDEAPVEPTLVDIGGTTATVDGESPPKDEGGTGTDAPDTLNEGPDTDSGEPDSDEPEVSPDDATDEEIGAEDAGPDTVDAPEVSGGCETGEDCGELELGACEVAACIDGVCEPAPADDETACDDGDACTEGDGCAAGICGGYPMNCDDGNVCTQGDCAEGACVYSNNTAPCDDADACTEADVCTEGSCGGVPVSCDDGDVCTTDACEAGECNYEKATGGPCSDGDDCTLEDVCGQAGCAGTPLVCEDSNPCTADACDHGECEFVNTPGLCDDGDACTAGDVCSEGQCAGTAIVCQDDNGCTDDVCKDGVCTFSGNSEPCEDGDPCTVDDVCSGDACSAGSNGCECLAAADCAAKEDGDVCNGTLACVANECVLNEASVVDCVPSANSCDVVSCIAATGQCEITTLGDESPCDDGTLCTEGDTCQGGQCVGEAISCDDKNVCTTDICVAGNCKHLGSVGGCDDNDPCTSGDLCVGGECVGQSESCDDENACTSDSCVSGDCVNEPTDGDCDDGDACSTNDKCVGGSCSGAAVPCNDGNMCTDDTCVDGLCVNTPNANTCDDGNACTGIDVCLGGTCLGKETLCVSPDVCLDAACDKTSGDCVTTANAATCDDGNTCTENDSCSGGTCKAGVNTCQCETSDDCVALEDGNLCNGTLVCESNECVVDAATVVSCPAPSAACLEFVCLPGSGECAEQASPDGTGCDDADACTTGDQCVGGACATTDLDCDDGNPCTQEDCDSDIGCSYAFVGGSCNDGRECTTAECVVPTVSTKSCTDFEWSAGANGSDAVCGESDAGLGGCSGVLNWSAAKTFCEIAGARLCTLGDLLDNETAGTGCTYDTHHLWTGTPCSDTGFYVAAGKVDAFSSKPVKCLDASASARTRCCADADVSVPVGSCAASNADCDDGDACTQDACWNGAVCEHKPLDCDDGDSCTSDSCAGGVCQHAPEAVGTTCDDGTGCTIASCQAANVSEKSCDALGWSLGSGSNDVCAQSNVAPEANGCSGEVPWGQADALCAESGGRLCTFAELLNNESSQSGCDYDFELAWSSTACGEGAFWVSPGNTSGTDAEPRCVAANQRMVTRCCADAAPAGITGTHCEGQTTACAVGESCGQAQCVEGTCVASVVDAATCADETGCTVDSCSALSGCSNALDHVACDDGIECTTDVCSEALDCQNTVEEGACDDGIACTTDACTESGCQYALDHASCDDGKACTEDVCTQPGGCASLQAAATLCDDGVGCTTEACAGDGSCVNTPVDADCEDGHACTANSCDAVDGCVTSYDHAACEDGNGCTKDKCSDSGCASEVDAGTACETANPCTTGQCGVPAGSQKSCIDLGWTTTPGDDDAVCGASALSTVCYENKSQTEAAALCGGAFGRLCTLDEMLAEETADTGCGFNATYNWTSTSCGDGAFWVAAGRDDYTATMPPFCEHADVYAYTVRCCGDAAPAELEPRCIDEGTDCGVDVGNCGAIGCEVGVGCINSSETDALPCCGAEDSPADCSGGNSSCFDCVAAVDAFCANGGWDAFCADCAQGGSGYGGACADVDCTAECACDTVCDDGDDCTTDVCSGGAGCVSWVAIEDAGVCGCASDAECDDGLACTVDTCHVVFGCQHQPNDGACDDGDQCTLDACEVGVGCVAAPTEGLLCDTGVCNTGLCGQLDRSAKTCGELGWSTTSWGSAQVCGESDGNGMGACLDKVDKRVAEAKCHGAGGRLCTLAELANDETRGTGCNYDAKMVWTQSPCGANAFWIGNGSTAGKPKYECQPENGDAAVRCCADVTTAPVIGCVGDTSPCDDGSACTPESCKPGSDECNAAKDTCGKNCCVEADMCAVGTAADGRCYSAFDQGGSWDAAQTACDGLGGELAVIRSAAGNAAALAEVAVVCGNDLAWIGLEDKDADGDGELANKEPLDYTNWNEGEPSGGEPEVTLLANGTWNDSASGSETCHVCMFVPATPAGGCTACP